MFILSIILFGIGFLLIAFDGASNAFHEWWLMGLGAVFIVAGLLCLTASI